MSGGGICKDSPPFGCVAVCCNVLQCIAVYCNVLQCVAMICNVFQRLFQFWERYLQSVTAIRVYIYIYSGVLQSVAECCRVLQCAAVRCSALRLQCTAMFCNDCFYFGGSICKVSLPFGMGVLQCVAVYETGGQGANLSHCNSSRVLQCVAVCCSVLQCVAACCSVLQCVAVCCSVLQCVALLCVVVALFHVGAGMYKESPPFRCVAVCCSVL